jgi:serine/threonine protein kinase
MSVARAEISDIQHLLRRRRKSASPVELEGRYQILQPLSRGAHGVILLAYDKQMQQPRIIKVLAPKVWPAPNKLPNWQERFKREAIAMAMPHHHPNLVTVYDCFDLPDSNLPGGRLVGIVMEYLSPEAGWHNVREWLEQSPDGFPPATAKTVMQGFLAALMVLRHQYGIVPRDNKPDNIMLAPTGVKLLDLGISNQVCNHQPGMIMGTPLYLSPERVYCECAAADAEPSDVFSSAAILFEMLTGQILFDGYDVDEIMDNIIQSNHTLHDRLQSHLLPSSTIALLTKALAPRVADRFQTLAEFGQAIELAL